MIKPIPDASIKPTILVVDDTPDNLSLISGILRDSYRVKIAGGGEKALEIASSAKPPDLILLDVMMPDMDGYEVCRRLKQNPATSGIPVIFISAENEENDELSGLIIGAVDFIAKPICPSIVLARVKTHLALTAALKELEKQNAVLAENVRLREDIEKMTRHDLKAPLTAFVNIPEMLIRDTGLNSSQKEMLAVLSKSADRMLEMINRSLDLCQMEQGTYKLISVPVNMVKLVYQVFNQSCSQAQLKEIKCSLVFNGKPASQEDNVEFNGEEFMFFSMLSNLVKNAIEASPVNSEVVVSLFDSPYPGISIKNQGAIPAQIRDRIFQRYATFGKEKGAGLGVYSARLMARTLGGDLCFKTSEDEGTTFIVTLGSSEMTHSMAEPGRENLAGRLPGKFSRTPSSEIIPAGEPKWDLPKSKMEMKILIADDFGYMRLIIKDILKKEGYLKFFEAADGEKAVAFLSQNQVDLVLCDWNMPEMNGLEVFQFMQSRLELKDIPFILITANAALSDIEKAANMGIRNYLVKPFSPDALSQKVETVLSNRKNKVNVDDQLDFLSSLKK